MGPALRLRLAHGLPGPAGPQRSARLRALTGAAEEGCLAAAEAGLPAREVLSLLLADCLEAVGDLAPIDAAQAAALSVGDREALALAIRAASFAGPMRARLACGACGEELDLDLDPLALLAEPDQAEPALLDLGALRLHCRAVTAADQAAVAPLAGDAAAAGAALLACCVRAEDAAGPRDVASLPGDIRDAAAAHLLALDPQAETRLDCACPACGAAVQGELDAGGFLLDEVLRRGPALAREVLLLARATGWAEAAILAMPRRRRLRYAALLAGEATA